MHSPLFDVRHCNQLLDKMAKKIHDSEHFSMAECRRRAKVQIQQKQMFMAIRTVVATPYVENCMRGLKLLDPYSVHEPTFDSDIDYASSVKHLQESIQHHQYKISQLVFKFVDDHGHFKPLTYVDAQKISSLVRKNIKEFMHVKKMAYEKCMHQLEYLVELNKMNKLISTLKTIEAKSALKNI
jgi:hypothetical protein